MLNFTNIYALRAGLPTGGSPLPRFNDEAPARREAASHALERSIR